MIQVKKVFFSAKKGRLFDVITLSITTLSITTLDIKALDMMSLDMIGLIATLGIYDTQDNDA